MLVIDAGQLKLGQAAVLQIERRGHANIAFDMH
jgi:hypothetical protein